MNNLTLVAKTVEEIEGRIAREAGKYYNPTYAFNSI